MPEVLENAESQEEQHADPTAAEQHPDVHVVAATDDASAQPGKPKTKKKPGWWNYALTALPLLVFVISIVVAFASPGGSVSQLTVVSALVANGNQYQINGRVLMDGDPVEQALVWAVVDYGNAQQDAPLPVQTDKNGGFVISPVPITLGTGNSGVFRAIVRARKDISGAWYEKKTTVHGEDTVHLGDGVASESSDVVHFSGAVLAPLVTIFLLSVLLPFFGEPSRMKYQLGIFLAFCVTGTMIVYISVGLTYVTTHGANNSDEVLQLGFASIYRSTYVETVPPDWVVSFTAPPKREEVKPKQPKEPTAPAVTTAAGVAEAQQPQPQTPAKPAEAAIIDKGFGAPLWVLLVSVIGAGVVTIALIVNEISQMSNWNDKDRIRNHVQMLVRHQFFILFSPITAIFVYQTLLAGSAANSDFTVGLAALGAAPALSGLITKAGAAATKLFE